MTNHTINQEQLDAVRRFARRAGRTWKSALRYNWERGSYEPASDADAALLRGLRNSHGPAWLAKFKLRA